MYATATTFSRFTEPEPLGASRTVTAPTVTAEIDALVKRIDRELMTPAKSTIIGTLLRGWTHVAQDVNPLFRYELITPLPPMHIEAWQSSLAALTSAATGFFDAFAARDRPALPGPSASQLDARLSELQSWLGIGLGPATEAAGISRGTVYAWRERNSNPRPGTVGAVLRVHGLVAAAVTAVGEDHARAWFHTGDPSPLEEMVAARGDAAQLRAVSARLRRELLAIPAPPANALMAATADDIVR